MCLYNKGCGFNKSHTTGFYDTWAACVKNNQPFTLPATHVFKNKMVASSVTVNQVALNNVGGTQAPPPINGDTTPAPVGVLHHMGDAVLTSKCSVQTKYVCEHHQNYVSYTELSLFIYDI